MFQVVVSEKAQKDLFEIYDSVLKKTDNKATAKKIIHKLRLGMEWLETFPDQGKKLNTLMPVTAEYRYLLQGDHCILYYESKKRIVIVRVLRAGLECPLVLLKEDYGKKRKVVPSSADTH